MAIGQIAQVTLQYRLLKQENGTFTLRELLKGVCVLDNGLREVSVRTTSETQSADLGVLSGDRSGSGDGNPGSAPRGEP